MDRKNIFGKGYMTLLLSVCVAWASAQNPYLPLWEFIPDGEPYVKNF